MNQKQNNKILDEEKFELLYHDSGREGLRFFIEAEMRRYAKEKVKAFANKFGGHQSYCITNDEKGDLCNCGFNDELAKLEEQE